MNNLFQRIITSIILIFILSISLFFNKYIWLFVLILCSLVLFIEFNNLTKKIWKKKKSTIARINIISLLFLVIFIYVSYEFYNKPLLFIISICIFSDTGGYIVGNLIGGKKLTKISPKKTYSGMFGSFITSSFIVYFAFKDYFENDFLFLIILFISAISQFGDIFISYLKRKNKKKDTGSILPGHGGILDRFDGIIFALLFGIFFKFII